MKETVNGSELM